MKISFVVLAIVLACLTVLAVGTLPGRRSGVPLIYWTSDPNPARGPQIAAFEKWMERKGYRSVDLELDSNNLGTMKVIIQSASGVGSEIIDVYGGAQLRQYVASGVLLDVTELAKEYGFGLDKTFASVRKEISVDGRQYTFPCNVTASTITINRALLEREGLPMAKLDWTWDEFLQWCLAVRKVDENGRVTRYAIWPFGGSALWAPNGGNIFNETMTRCVINSPQVLEATKFYYDLMFKYKVMPTPVEREAVASQGGYGGSSMQWLGNELTVAVKIGRYGLIQLRKFKDFKPDVALMPHKVMPMQFVFSRSAGINAGASDPKLAARFLEFLADETYNSIIVGDADALPPNPRMCESPEFLTPAEYPGEHGAHEKYKIAAEEYGVGMEYSDFINPVVVSRLIGKFLSGVESKELTVEEALAKMTDEINLEMQHAVERDAKLGPKYEEAMARQRRIDRLKAEGKAVPLEMIDNPVIRRLREAGK